MKFLRCGQAVCLLVTLCAAPLAPGQPAVQPGVSDDWLLMELRLEGQPLAPALEVFQSGTAMLLPLGELARLLELVVEVDPESGKADGFVRGEQRPFRVDLAKRTLRCNGQITHLDARQLSVIEPEVYLDSRLLGQCLELDLQVDTGALAVNVRALEPLPMQERRAREKQAAALRGMNPDDATPTEHVEPHHRLLGLHFSDTALEARWWEAPESSGSDVRYSSLLTGDLLGLEAVVYGSGRTSAQGEDIFRATLGRTDPDARLLGPLHARSVAAGSVPVAGIANISRASPAGWGALLHNRRLTQVASFDRFSLQGDLPQGWDVELYFNGALIGYQRADAEGRYSFDDLSLIYGANEFRLVFHGPQGQVREEIRRFLLDDVLARPGELLYQLAAHEDDAGQQRVLAQFDLGLSRHFSLAAGWTQLPLLGTPQTYTFGGLRAALGPMFWNLDVVQSKQGRLYELGTRLRLGGVAVGLRHARVEEFVSDYYLAYTDPLEQRNQLRLDGTLRVAWLPPLSMSLDVQQDQRKSGLRDYNASQRIGSYIHGTSLSHQLRWSEVETLRAVDGVFQIGRRMLGVGLRGQVNYQIDPLEQMTAVSLYADRRVARGYLAYGSISRGFLERQTRYTAGLNKILGRYAFGLSAGYATHDELILGLQFFVSTGRDPARGEWHFDARPGADSGAVSARAYLDANANGRQDADEALLPGVGFLVDGARRPMRTDASGPTFLPQLPVYRHVRIELDPQTLEDPQWRAGQGALSTFLHPGHVESLAFPVVMTSEIDGTVYGATSGRRRGIGGVELELYDRQGRLMGKTMTASDGFYVMPSVPAGEYLLVSPIHIQQQLRRDTGLRLLRIPANGDFVSGIDFDLTPASSAPAPRPAPAPVQRLPRVPTQTQTVYTVVAGDWLWKIAAQFYGRATAQAVANLLEANPQLASGAQSLRPGMRLRIPAPVTPAAERRTPIASALAPSPPECVGEIYTVRAGDWLWRLAGYFYGAASNETLQRILDANPDSLSEDQVLRPGQPVRVPADAPARCTPAASARPTPAAPP
jgi:phage tail protein X